MREEDKAAVEGMEEGFALIKKAMKALAEDNAKYDPLVTMPVAHIRRDFSGAALAISELRRLRPVAKAFLEHHINNTINTVGLYCELNMPTKARECAWQLADILEQIMEPERCTCDYASDYGSNRCTYHERLSKEADHGYGADVKAEDPAALHPLAGGQAGGEDVAAGA